MLMPANNGCLVACCALRLVWANNVVSEEHKYRHKQSHYIEEKLRVVIAVAEVITAPLDSRLVYV